jgi:hypothetical protein
MRRHRVSRDDIGRDDAPALERSRPRRRRMRTRQGERDRWSAFLIRLRHVADAESGDHVGLQADLPELAVDFVGRILRPDPPHDVDCLHDLAIAHAGVGMAEQLKVRQKSARSDAEHEAAAAHVIELRHLGRDHDRIVIGNADHAGAEAQILGPRHQARHEHQRRRDRLARCRKVLAEPQFLKAKPIGQQRFLGILGERVGERTRRRMHRHHEKSETHIPPVSMPGCGGVSRRSRRRFLIPLWRWRNLTSKGGIGK